MKPFEEFTTLASLAMIPNARAQQVQADTEKRAHDLDLMYPGSTFTQVLKSPHAALAKEIYRAGNISRASLLCACTAVLIYLDLR